MPAAADGQLQIALVREDHHALHVGNACAVGDQCRSTIDVAVPDAPRGFVAFIGGLQQLPTQRGAQRCNVGLGDRRLHAVQGGGRCVHCRPSDVGFIGGEGSMAVAVVVTAA